MEFGLSKYQIAIFKENYKDIYGLIYNYRKIDIDRYGWIDMYVQIDIGRQIDRYRKIDR